jgi:hypothetical protein
VGRNRGEDECSNHPSTELLQVWVRSGGGGMMTYFLILVGLVFYAQLIRRIIKIVEGK